MQFLQRTDFLSLIDEDTLQTISNEDNVLIDETEARAIEEMSTYLNNRYDILAVFDTNSRNNLIVMYLVDIVLYHLHSRISPDNIPELRVKRYDSVVSWLEKVADGFISPLLPTNTSDTRISLRYGNTSSKQEHYY